MPALCRELGIDRFTSFPYFGLGYQHPEKYQAEMTLASLPRPVRRAVLWKRCARPRPYHVSLEIPSPSDQVRIAFGLEVRAFYDFARIETNEWTLGRFLNGLAVRQTRRGTIAIFCGGKAPSEVRTMRVIQQMKRIICIPVWDRSPAVDLSRTTPFRFPDSEGFMALWQGRSVLASAPGSTSTRCV